MRLFVGNTFLVAAGETIENAKTLCSNLIALLRKVTLRLSTSVSHHQGQKPLDPPSLLSNVASFLSPGALKLHFELLCAHPPWVQQYILVTLRVNVGLSRVFFAVRGGRVVVCDDGLFNLVSSCCMERKSFSISRWVEVSLAVARVLLLCWVGIRDVAASDTVDGAVIGVTWLESAFNVTIKFASSVRVSVNSSRMSFAIMLIWWNPACAIVGPQIALSSSCAFKKWCLRFAQVFLVARFEFQSPKAFSKSWVLRMMWSAISMGCASL